PKHLSSSAPVCPTPVPFGHGRKVQTEALPICGRTAGERFATILLPNSVAQGETRRYETNYGFEKARTKSVVFEQGDTQRHVHGRTCRSAPAWSRSRPCSCRSPPSRSCGRRSCPSAAGRSALGRGQTARR